MRKIILFIVPLLFCVFSINAQNINVEENAAFSLVSASKTTLGLSAEDLSNSMVSSTSYDDASRIRMVYLTQTYQGVPVFNQMLVLAFRDGKLISQAGAFNKNLQKFAAGKSAAPAVTAASAVQSAISDRGLHASQMAIAINSKNNGQKVEFSNMGISHSNITAQLMWTPVGNLNELRLSWHIYIEPKTTSDLWMVRVDAENNRILGLDNYTDYDNWGTPDVNGLTKYPAFAYADLNSKDAVEKFGFQFKHFEDPSLVTTASYRVVPFPAEAPTFPLGAHAIRTDPWTAAPGNATTLKWHTGAAAADYSHTRSNNVFAYQDRANDNTGTIADAVTSTTAFPNLTFDFTPNYTVDPTQTTPVPNQQFNTVNLFYWNNVIHDVMYVYGFTESSFNFQDDNLGRGGAGNDHVNAEAQDGGGTNNANFGTPADGGSGRMQMYLWNGGTPNRDGDVDNGIVVHEYGHGISNRLTGGGSGACLGNAEQMGEGWSDYYALMFTQDWATATLATGFNSPRGIGTYALFQPTTGVGIRSQKYCTDFTINNKVYLTSLPAGPHPRGEIWCATLWDMTWNIINQVGTINPNLYNFAGGGGNAIALKLVTEGLKLQQCGPGFISGRNAILQADQNLYGGLYNCAIWEAFRRRGMGAFASEGSANSVTDQVPDFTPPLTLGATVSAATIPEGSNLTYTNSLTTCSAVSGYTLRDTLPSNVTYVSGGTYDAPNRVVSFAVNQAAGTTNYPFIVNVNTGSYFPPVTLLTEAVATATIPAAWTVTTPAGNPWTVSTTVSNSAPNSFYVQNMAISGDQILTTTGTFALPLNSYPELSFWHKWNTEDGWDGGVVEISTNGGTTWSDIGAANFTLNGYNGGLGAAPTNVLTGRAAFTGLQSTFINTKINLSQYNGQTIKLRFHFGSDDNTTAPTAPEGWWIDDITLSYKAAVNMRSNLFNAANTRVAFKDMVTEITQVVACAPTINQQPVDVTTCAGTSVTYTCVGTATGGVTYQWQISTTGIGGTYTNLANGAPYSGVTTSTLTVNPTAVGLNGNYYRCVVTGTCNPTATSNPAGLFVAAGSTAGTVTPANTNVCGTTNTGLLTVAGFNGNVVRWESATNIAGPWTPIAVTTATYTFTNVAVTTFFRAVTQFGTCASANSSIATVTFAAASPIVIVADPGTTVCAGDPTRLTVYEGNITGPTTIPLAAQTGTFTGSARGYYFTAPANFTMTAIRVPTDASAGNQHIAVVRFTGATPPPAFPTTTNAFTTLFLTQNNTTAGNIPVNIAINAGDVIGIMGTRGADVNSYAINPNSTTIGTFTVPLTRMGMQFPLATTAPQQLWTEAASISRIFFDYTIGSLGPVATGTFLWTPPAGLSSTTSNPVAASPMATTTYTVNVNNGAGCIRQANITITVNERPAVTTQPVASVNCAGSTATFTVAGVGAGLTYQWQENVSGCTGGTWNNLTNGGAYAGANTATLIINPVTGAMSGYGYRCVLGGTCAPVNNANISNCAALTVNALPVVTITPAGPVCGGVAGINGTQLSTASAPVPVPGSVVVNSGTINLAVPDNTANGVSNVIAMAGVPANATITNVSVTLNMSHTYPGDMIYNLRAPNGAILSLYKYGTGAFTGPASGVPTWGWYGAKVSQTGTIAWGTVATAPFIYNNSTAWKADAINTPVAGATIQNPTGFVSAATGFADLYTTPASTTGNWTLAMCDGGPGDVGSLASWTLTIDYTVPGTSGSPLTYTWSPAAGLYMNAQATVPYIAGTQTPVVYAAPTVLTSYTATGTNSTTGCVGTSTVLVNYTPGAPVVTPNPVPMCLGDVPVKLKATSTGTPAVWSPATGLYSNAGGTTAYIAGTAVDSVWAQPTTIGANTYTAIVQSLGIAPTAIQTTFTNNNQFALVTANFKNNNGFPVTITGFESIASTNGASIATLFFKTTPVNGAPGAISAANGWNVAGTGTYTAIANTTTTTPQAMLSGISLTIPAGATYGLAFQSETAANVGNLRYSTVAAGTYTNSASGCDVISGTNASYAGGIAPIAPLNTPRAFIGRVLFGSNVTPCISAPRTVVVTVNQPLTLNASLPVNQTVCTDKVATFSVAVTAGTGPLTYLWQVSVAGGAFANVLDGGVYSGASTATLTITAPPVSMSGYRYRVIVSGAAPCAAATSSIVTLTVNPLPVITVTPSSSSLFPGLTATLTATVTPNAAATYTWIRNGIVLSSTSQGVLSGIGTGALKVDVDGQGVYSLRVTDVNGCTNVSNNAIVKDSASGRCFIYPNPSSGVFQVRYYSVAGNTNLPRGIVVYDAKGDRVYNQNYTVGRPYDRMDVDMRAYGKGLYWVEIVDRNGNRLSMCRVIIQ
jgi:subtilisin-like proprotein convertase family protein